MSIEIARSLYRSARAHALSGNLLYNAAFHRAEEAGDPDPAASVFNGTHSLSINYLIGLCLELYLKSAYVLAGGPSDDKSLRDIGHKLVSALDAVEQQGFKSDAPHLREIAEHLNEPYSQHYFRYSQPEQMALPDVADVYNALQVLDDELSAQLFPEQPPI